MNPAQRSGESLTPTSGENSSGSDTYDLVDLARRHGQDVRLARLVLKLRCHRCGRAPVRCHLETGPELARRGRMRRLALVGVYEGDRR